MRKTEIDGPHSPNGMQLYLARREKGLTQVQVAEAAELNVRQLVRLEKGENLPTQPVRDRLAAVLELDPRSIRSSADREPDNGPLPLELAWALLAALQQYLRSQGEAVPN